MTAPKQFLRLPDVKARVGLSRTAIYRDMEAGLFPKQFSIAPNVVVWDSDEIEQWQQAKLAAARAGAAPQEGGSRG
jgi:prophage regulatory protein